MSGSTMRAQLPAFGRLCSMAAKALGRDEFAFAGPKQKLWHLDAIEVLAKIQELGGDAGPFIFFARDERGAGFRWEERIGGTQLTIVDGSGLNGDNPAIARSVPASLANHLLGRADDRLRHVAASREAEGASHVMEAMAKALGTDRAARICVIAHEWGHAWINQKAPALAIQAAMALHDASESASAPSSAPCKDAAFHPGAGPRRRHHPAEQVAVEGLCDAFACWVLDRMGMPGMAPKLAGFRRAHAAMRAAPTHHTHRILSRFFPAGEPMPADFKGFERLAQGMPARPASSPKS